jgi:hypothetical protein
MEGQLRVEIRKKRMYYHTGDLLRLYHDPEPGQANYQLERNKFVAKYGRVSRYDDLVWSDNEDARENQMRGILKGLWQQINQQQTKYRTSFYLVWLLPLVVGHIGALP